MGILEISKDSLLNLICFCAEASDITQSFPVMSHSSTDLQVAVMYGKVLVNNS